MACDAESFSELADAAEQGDGLLLCHDGGKCKYTFTFMQAKEREMDLELTTMNAQEFGSRLKALRKAKGVNQEAVASATKGLISRVAISNWERGEAQKVDAEALYLVAEFLGTTPGYLLYGKQSQRRPIEDLDAAWAMLTPAQQREIAQIAAEKAKLNAEILETLKPRR